MILGALAAAQIDLGMITIKAQNKVTTRSKYRGCMIFRYKPAMSTHRLTPRSVINESLK